ncbi:MAG: hypothetical protein AAGB04_14445, partial [Pseudomonadota bacterium]
MKIQIQKPGFIATLFMAIVVSGLSIWAAYYGFVTNPELQWLGGLGCLFLLAIIFYPVGTAWDLSDDIPEIKALKKDSRYKKVTIRHPSFWWVVILSVAALISAGLTWFIALFMVSGSINVDIPDDVAVAAGLKEDLARNTSVRPTPSAS